MAILRSVSPLLLALVVTTTAWAQTPTPGPTPAPGAGAEDTPTTPVATPPDTPPDATPHRDGGVRGFFRDVGRDYRQWISLDTTRTLVVGTAAAMLARPLDDEITSQQLSDIGDSLTVGDEYGNLSLQVPLAVAWWGIGKARGSRKAAEAGRDLLRAQISATSWTYVVKYAVRRTRPNGDPRSFPSGHSSATFAAATVLQRHYGWKLGVPFYALGVYTAASRIHDRKHWLSDTVMGATVGIAAGRAVTFRLRQRPLHIAPAVTRGGAMVQIVVDP